MNYTISNVTLDANYKTAAPFHGDIMFIEIIYKILASSKFFIETGTAHGDTLKFVIDNFSNLKSISCEPDDIRFDNTSRFIPAAEIVKTTSPDIFEYVERKYPESFGEKSVFWLDAHGEYNGKIFWPLRAELNFILKNYQEFFILIDDFKNPFNPNYSFDTVNGIQCGIEYIRDILIQKNLNVYFPNYTEKTSKECSCLVGWVLITNQEINDNRLTRFEL